MIEIPLDANLPNFEFNISLELFKYRFHFLWNERMQLWTVDIGTTDGVDMVNGQPVWVSYSITDRFKNPLLPKGVLLFVDSSGKNLTPGRDDLGNRVKFYYIPSDEIGV